MSLSKALFVFLALLSLAFSRNLQTATNNANSIETPSFLAEVEQALATATPNNAKLDFLIDIDPDIVI